MQRNPRGAGRGREKRSGADQRATGRVGDAGPCGAVIRYLITGGTGFIGRALCGELLAAGHAVTVLTRRSATAAARLPSPVEALESLAGLREPVDAVINLAGANLGERRWTAPRKQEFLRSRLDTTRTLVDWMAGLSRRPRVLVSGSAIGWYGARGDETLTEDSPGGGADEWQAQLCRAWEAEARRAAALGVAVACVRTGIVLERDGGPLARMLPPFRLGLGGPLGHGRQWMSWIHRADLVALLLWLSQHEAPAGAWNGTAPQPVTNREFSHALGAALRRPALLPMPAPALRLVVGEMADILLTGQRIVPARALAGGFRFRYPALSEALAAILRR